MTACGSSGGSADEASSPTSEAVVETTESSSTEPVADEQDESSGSEGEIARFCAAAQDVLDAFIDDTAFEPESVELFDALRSSAPEEIADDIETFVEGNKAIIEQTAQLDENDPEAPNPAAVISDDPEYAAADDRTFEYATVTCDFEVPTQAGDNDSTDVEDADEDEIDPNVISIDGLQQYFEDDPAAAELLAKVTTYGVSFDRDITLGGAFIGDEAEAICTTALDYALAIDGEATVQIGTESTTNEAFEETLLVEGDQDGCSVV